MLPTDARPSTRPIRWALRMLRDPSLVDGAGASAPPRGCDDAARARSIAWLLCSRSG
jgi:hypothetical protein